MKKSLLRLSDLSVNDIYSIFQITDKIEKGEYSDFLKGKTIVLFFPSSSLRTRVTFEKGIFQLGGQSILFPPETLDKKEDLYDVAGYLDNWIELLVVRHKDIHVLEQLKEASSVPIINGMTNINHPCEILADLYALSKIRTDFTKDKYLFCGKKGNIGLGWYEASKVLNLDLEQCCAKGYEIEGLKTYNNINDAIIGKDIVCTDSLSENDVAHFSDCQVTKDAMDKANPKAILNPCPPFYCGQEVSSDVINSKYFVGYHFKKSLLQVQQAIMIYCLS